MLLCLSVFIIQLSTADSVPKYIHERPFTSFLHTHTHTYSGDLKYFTCTDQDCGGVYPLTAFFPPSPPLYFSPASLYTFPLPLTLTLSDSVSKLSHPNPPLRGVKALTHTEAHTQAHTHTRIQRFSGSRKVSICRPAHSNGILYT